MKSRYPYLKKRTYLLSAAWVNRILKYLKVIQTSENNDAVEGIQIGKQSVRMLKEYGILK